MTLTHTEEWERTGMTRRSVMFACLEVFVSIRILLDLDLTLDCRQCNWYIMFYIIQKVTPSRSTGSHVLSYRYPKLSLTTKTLRKKPLNRIMHGESNSPTAFSPSQHFAESTRATQSSNIQLAVTTSAHRNFFVNNIVLVGKRDVIMMTTVV